MITSSTTAGQGELITLSSDEEIGSNEKDNIVLDGEYKTGLTKNRDTFRRFLLNKTATDSKAPGTHARLFILVGFILTQF